MALARRLPAWSALAFTVLLSSVTAAGADAVASVARELNLRGYVARLEERFTFTSERTSAVLCLPAALAQGLLDLLVFVDDPAESLPHRPLSVPSAPANASCYRVDTKRPTRALQALWVLGGRQRPLPETIAQSDAQLMTFEGTIPTVSPYAVPEQTLLVHLPTDNIISYSRPQAGAAVRADGSKIAYAGVRDTPPWGAIRGEGTQLALHYENNSPFLHIESLHRTVTVSHWGRVYVEEEYAIRHAGARVVGPFSRLNVTSDQLRGRRASSPIIYGVSAVLPGSAAHVYQTDALGHVLSLGVSRRTSAGGAPVTVAALQPRFPLLGSWRTQFTLGYSLPLNAALTTAGRTRRLIVAFAPPISEDYIADEVTTEVILPEGASRLQVAADGLRIASVADARRFTYFDTPLGRPAKVIRMANVTGIHRAGLVTVSYDFLPLAALIEPGLLSGAVFLVLMAIIAAARLDLTIVRDATWRAKRDRARAHEVAMHLDANLGSLYRAAVELGSALTAVTAQATGEQRERISAAVAEVKEYLPGIVADTERLRALSPGKAATVVELHDCLLALVEDAKNVTGGRTRGRQQARDETLLELGTLKAVIAAWT